jgi:hypothetical protein
VRVVNPAPVAGPPAASARGTAQPVADSDVAGRDRRGTLVARELADELQEVPASGAVIVITFFALVTTR